MKTVLTLLLVLLTFTLGCYFISLTIEVFNNSNQTYLGQTTNEVYNFRFVLTISALFLIVFAILSFAHTAYFISIFHNNYSNILKRKRDNDIRKQLLNAKYDKLYEELSNTNIYEVKEEIVRKFYSDTKIKGIKDLLDSIIKDKERELAKIVTKEPSIIKERDTFAG